MPIKLKFILSFGLVLAVNGLYTAANAETNTTSPEGHQAIKAKVVKDDPADYTINVKMLSNMGANEEADTFAVYVVSSLPEQCGDFASLEIPYSKPEKYLRRFDLSSNMDVYQAIKDYGCVVIKNIPPPQK